MRTAPVDPLTAAFTEHQAFVRERLRGLGVAPAELDDATQDVFEVLARRIADLDPNRPVRAWLAGVARKVARRHRERGRRVLLPIDEARLASAASSPERRAAEVDARAVLDAFMAELDHDRWAVFVLAEIEGLRGTEIAAELDLNLNTVYARLRSARAAFERTLKRHHARDLRGRQRAWMLLPGTWARPWRWASLGVATVGLVGGLSVVSRGGCAVEDELGHAAEQPATAAIDPGQQDASVPHTRPLPAWMIDADHEADMQRRADQDGDPEPWREAGWGFAERSNDAGERFELTHELRYRLAGDRLILAITFTGDDDVDVDGIEARVDLDGFELVDGDEQTEISLAPAEVLTHTWTLRAVRVSSAEA